MEKETINYHDEYAKHDAPSAKTSKQMEQSQAELATMQFVGKSAQDLVQATLTGDKKVISIDFNPAVVDPEDLETLSDMTVQAINSALEQINETTKKKLGAFAGKFAILIIRKTGSIIFVGGKSPYRYYGAILFY